MINTPGSAGFVQPTDESLVTYTHAIYALHSLAVLIGLSKIGRASCRERV